MGIARILATGRQTHRTEPGQWSVRPRNAPPTTTKAPPATATLLKAAADLAAMVHTGTARPAFEAALAAFLRLYSAWIIHHRGMSGSLDVWLEQSRILLHCMVSAETLEQAVELLVRFDNTFWGRHVEVSSEHQDECVTLSFREPARPGAEGLIVAMWPLIATVNQLDFLGGRELQGVAGRVRNSACVCHDTVKLLFRGKLAYNAAEAALIIPRAQLRHAVVAKAADIPSFFANFMSTAVGPNLRSSKIGATVAGLLRNDKLRRTNAPADFPSMAARLGCSAATLRRKLDREGTAYRVIKEDVLDEVARRLLRDTDDSIAHIAEQLGYSDSYAFRRAFSRRNGRAPTSWRESVRGITLVKPNADANEVPLHRH